jgi:hypothetical protein
MTISEIVEGLKTNKIRAPDVGGDESRGVDPMIFASVLADEGATAEECDAAANGHCPADLKQFWQLARSGKVFEDTTSGQWGLQILSPKAAAAATKKYRKDWGRHAAMGDLIVGRFIGDEELLLVRTEPNASDFGSVVIVAEMDPRPDWYIAAVSFGEFLNRYVDARGDKYWDLSGTELPDS